MPRRTDRRLLDNAFTWPTQRTTLGSAVTARLREVILDAQLPPGTPLPPAQLAPRLGVSVMPVREALRILEAEGLVTFTPRIGARVADVSEEDLEEIYLARATLEGLAARLAVERQAPDDLARLAEAFEQMRAAQERGDTLALMRWDREFHLRQYGASRRPRLVKRILDLWDAGRRAYLLLPSTADLVGWRTTSHAAILAACQRADPQEAERLTRAHTEEAFARLQRALRAERTRAPQIDAAPGSAPAESLAKPMRVSDT